MPGRQQTCGFAQIRAAQEAPAGRQAARALHRYRAGSACRLVSPSPGQDRFGPAHHLRPGGPPRGRHLVLLTALCEEVDPRNLAEQTVVGEPPSSSAARSTPSTNGYDQSVTAGPSSCVTAAISGRSCATGAPRLAASLKARSRGPPPCTRTTDPAPRTVDASSPLSPSSHETRTTPSRRRWARRPPRRDDPSGGTRLRGDPPANASRFSVCAVLGVRARRSCPPRDLAQ